MWEVKTALKIRSNEEAAQIVHVGLENFNLISLSRCDDSAGARGGREGLRRVRQWYCTKALYEKARRKANQDARSSFRRVRNAANFAPRFVKRAAVLPHFAIASFLRAANF